MKTWLEGGLLGASIGFLLGVIAYFVLMGFVIPVYLGLILLFPYVIILKLPISLTASSFILKNLIWFAILIQTVLYFIIGSIIGLIIQKLKSK